MPSALDYENARAPARPAPALILSIAIKKALRMERLFAEFSAVYCQMLACEQSGIFLILLSQPSASFFVE